MKKLLLPILFCVSFSVEATHSVGGTIYWKCLDNGKYQFFMEFYGDCSGVLQPFGPELLIQIFGSPLPKNDRGSEFSSIRMKHDSVQNINGFNKPQCSYVLGRSIDCSMGNSRDANGFVRTYYFFSDPITIKGIPPSKGWHFRWNFCCRPNNIRNVVTTSNLVLSSTMYPSADGTDSYPCIDSSPFFDSQPNIIMCRGLRAYYNTMAEDLDFDSLVYSWAKPLTTPITEPLPMTYNEGYNFDNPTPDTSFDFDNIPSSLNSSTGIIDFKAVNDTGVQKYLSVVNVDSYRNGKKIARVRREFLLSVFDCVNLPGNKMNEAPRIFIDGIERNKLDTNISQGDKVIIPIKVINDDSSSLSLRYKFLRIYSSIDDFSTGLTDSLACLIPPCPELKNKVPLFDSISGGYILGDGNEVKTELVWQVDCSHGYREKDQRYKFIFQISDEGCPSSRVMSASIDLIVKAENKERVVIATCPNRLGNNRIELEWESLGIEQEEFEQWYIQRSLVVGANYTLVDSISDFNQNTFIDAIQGAENLFYAIEAKTKICEDRVIFKSNAVKANVLIDTGVEKTANYLASNERDVAYQWYNCSIEEIVKDSIRRSFVPKDTGNYSVIVTKYGCSDTSGCIPVFPKCFEEVEISELNNILTTEHDSVEYKWYNCSTDTIITDATRQSFAPKDTGSFAVIVERLGCSDTSQCIKVFPVGIQENLLQDKLSYYPNPTTGQLTIELDEIQNNLQVQLRNIHGQLIREVKFKNTQRLDLTIDADAGIYFIQLINDKKEQANLKILKQ